MTSVLRQTSLTFVLATSFGSNVAMADEPSRAERDAAKKLYEEAAREVDQGNYQSACGKFAEALFLTPGHIRTAISLGACMDKWGKPASALEHYADARRWANEQSKSDKVAEIDTLIGALAPKLSRLTIVVPARWARVKGLAVRRGDEPIPTSDWGTAKVLDPGSYEISVSADGQSTWKTQIELKIGQETEVTIAPPWKEDESGGGSGSTWGFVGIGVGAAGIVAGGVFGGIALAKYNESTRRDYCNAQNQCILAGYDLRLRAQQFGNVSTGLFIAGGILAAGGLTLLVLSSNTSKKESAASRTSIAIHPGGMVVSGSF